MTQESEKPVSEQLIGLFNETVTRARLWHTTHRNMPVSMKEFSSMKDAFHQGLETIIGKNLPPADGVNKDHLRDMQAIALNSWESVETIKALHSYFHRLIYKKEYEEEKDFPSEGQGLTKGDYKAFYEKGLGGRA